MMAIGTAGAGTSFGNRIVDSAQNIEASSNLGTKIKSSNNQASTAGNNF
jgi:hypothetical protein